MVLTCIADDIGHWTDIHSTGLQVEVLRLAVEAGRLEIMNSPLAREFGHFSELEATHGEYGAGPRSLHVRTEKARQADRASMTVPRSQSLYYVHVCMETAVYSLAGRKPRGVIPLIPPRSWQSYGLTLIRTSERIFPSLFN